MATTQNNNVNNTNNSKFRGLTELTNAADKGHATALRFISKATANEDVTAYATPDRQALLDAKIAEARERYFTRRVEQVKRDGGVRPSTDGHHQQQSNSTPSRPESVQRRLRPLTPSQWLLSSTSSTKAKASATAVTPSLPMQVTGSTGVRPLSRGVLGGVSSSVTPTKA